MKDLITSFEEAKAQSKGFYSGCFKFTTDYVSAYQLYQVAQEWLKTDKNVLQASIRSGATRQIALDFRYDARELSLEEHKSLFHKNFIPYFKEKLGGDFMPGYDFSADTIVIQ
jgi:hypothetical protein